MAKKLYSPNDDAPEEELPPEKTEPKPEPKAKAKKEPESEAPQSQVDKFMGEQGKLHAEAVKQAKEERQARIELAKSVKPTARTLQEQEAGKRMAAEHEARVGKAEKAPKGKGT